MRGFELPPELFNLLMGGNRKDCHACESGEKKDILELDGNEIEEWNLISIERDRVAGEIKKIQLDQKANETRKELFWLNLERKHGFDGYENLKIVNRQRVVAANCKLDKCSLNAPPTSLPPSSQEP